MRRRTMNWRGPIAIAKAPALLLSACSAPAPSPQEPEVIEKGTPFGDLLVPKLEASVTDGAIGVPVDSPVTVSAGDGVLGAVSLVNEDRTPVDGALSPDGLTWESAEPLGYNKEYTLSAEALGLGG